MGSFRAVARISLTVLATGCSSTTSGSSGSLASGPACTIPGTYVLTGTKEGGNCPSDPNAALTVTIGANGPGAYLVEIEGVAGGCPAKEIEPCKVQGKCDLTVRDPVDPQNGTGTVQYSWTFNQSGFSGFSSLSLPATKTTVACRGTETSSATRR